MEKDYRVEDIKLANGLKVIFAEDRSIPLVSVQMHVRFGSAWESEAEAGFSHFAEHLVFRSTRNYPDGIIMDRVAYLGGSMNAYTEYDSTCYYIDISKEYLEETIKILGDLVRYPEFTQADFNSEKKVIIEELKESENDREDNLIERIANDYLKDNPYRNPIIGNRKSLKNATREILQEFIQGHYYPGNCVLVVAGDFERNQLDEWINKYFADWEGKESTERKPVYGGHPEKFSFKVIKHKSDSDIVAVAIPDLTENHPDAIALSVVYKSFMIGKNSYLYDELFKRRKLVDSIKINGISGINDGVSIILLFPNQGIEALDVIKGFCECWNDFCSRGISAVQLMQQKAEILNSFRFSREYMESYASNLGMDEIYSDYHDYFTFPDKLKQISRGAIRAVIDKWLRIDYMKIYYQGSKNVSDLAVKQIFTSRQPVNFNHADQEYAQRTLANGIKVLYRKIIGKPTVGISAVFNVSQLYEEEGIKGINSVSGALMLYGNQQHNYDKFLDFCSLHGINMRISPQMDYTTLKCKCFTEDLAMALESVSNVLFAPELPREHFLNIKQAILSMMRRQKDYPQREALKNWRKMIYSTKSNLYSRDGRRNDLNKLTLSRVRRWQKDYYTPDNMTLVVTGDIDFSAVDELVEKHFGDKTGKHIDYKPNYQVYPSVKRYKVIDTQSSQGIIVTGGFGPGLESQEEAMAMSVLCQILGGDTNSQLFNELREQHGLAYSVDMDYYTMMNSGSFIMAAAVDRENTEIGLKMIKRIFKQVGEKGVSEYELTKVKNHLAGQMLQQEESVSAIASTMGSRIALGLGLEHYLNRRERLLAVTGEQVKLVAKKYLREDKLYTLIQK
ncbi:MAG: pitrilysin family protein [Candidatus Stygibacter australis]|nr:pitrilysin family protein [Candidatus Stygibacter australis]